VEPNGGQIAVVGEMEFDGVTDAVPTAMHSDSLKF
jgi:hypothetical protein